MTDVGLTAWHHLVDLNAILLRNLRRELQQATGLSDTDYSVLAALVATPEAQLRSSALAECLGWERSRLSHQIGRMEKRGLIRRDETPGDNRGARVVLTAAGRSAITQAEPVHLGQVHTWLLDALTAEQTRSLAHVLSTALLHAHTLEEQGMSPTGQRTPGCGGAVEATGSVPPELRPDTPPTYSADR